MDRLKDHFPDGKCTPHAPREEIRHAERDEYGSSSSAKRMLPRRGFTILELSVAMIILGALMTLCVKWVGASGAQQREVRWREAALAEAANVMERLAAQKWDELSPERVAKVAISEETRQRLPDGSLAVQVTQSAGEPVAKEIAVTVRWRPRTGVPDAQVRLVAWRFR